MRLDRYLASRGGVRSRERAQAAIKSGRVRINGEPATKPSQPVGPNDDVFFAGEAHPYVSRGALKLEAALSRFDIPVADRICLDLGASTGGFTQILLRGGAARVYAVDVGHGQLDAELATDPRVVSLERTHADMVDRRLITEPIGLLVCDVSFIGLRRALPPSLDVTCPGANLVALFKPQFEVGKEHIGKGGIVALADEETRARAEDFAGWLADRGWPPLGVEDSPIRGGDGNKEYLVAARRAS